MTVQELLTAVKMGIVWGLVVFGVFTILTLLYFLDKARFCL